MRLLPPPLQNRPAETAGLDRCSRPRRPAPKPRWRRPQVELDKTVVRAGVSGRVEQFVLRVGDIVNPMMRPAGVLIPEGAGQRSLQAGFGQIEAQIMKVGMIAEVTCVSKPFTIIPMVVTDVQDFIAAGQFRGGEQLIDAQQVTRPGTLLVFLEPLYKGGLDGVTPGSSCIANAYSNNHDVIAAKETGTYEARRSSRRGCPRAGARPDPAAPGAGASLQDPGVQRTLKLASATDVVRARRMPQPCPRHALSRVNQRISLVPKDTGDRQFLTWNIVHAAKWMHDRRIAARWQGRVASTTYGGLCLSHCHGSCDAGACSRDCRHLGPHGLDLSGN